jgi:hypothetical protein
MERQSVTSTDYPIKPLTNDILVGRGKKISRHEGNAQLRDKAMDTIWEYIRANKREKSRIINELLQWVNNHDPPGRFLEQNPQDGKWHETSLETARLKVSQLYRDTAAKAKRGDDVKSSRKDYEEACHQASLDTNVKLKVSPLSRDTSSNMKQDETGEHLTDSKDVIENRISSQLEKDLIFSDIEDSYSFNNADNFESDSIDTISLSSFCSCSNSISESIHFKDFDDIPTMNSESIRNQYTSFALPTQGKKDVRLDTNRAEHIDLKSFDWYHDTQFMRKSQSRPHDEKTIYGSCVSMPTFDTATERGTESHLSPLLVKTKSDRNTFESFPYERTTTTTTTTDTGRFMSSAVKRGGTSVSYTENSCSPIRSNQHNDAHQPAATAVSEISNKLSRRGISSNDSICMQPLAWCSYDGLSTTKPVQQQEPKHFRSLDEKSMYGSCISMPPLDGTMTGSINTEITR